VTCAILVPVLNRPDAAAPLVESVRETTDSPVVFLCSPRDHDEIRACRRASRKHRNVRSMVVPWVNGPGDYSRKVNYGIRHTTESWLFQAADDLRFHEGWLDAALAVADATGCRVIGTNDLGNPRVMRGRHATHSLVARSYVQERGTWDEPGVLLHEGYRHNFCDDEMVLTATWRKEFAFARDSVVEHLHPNWRKGVDDDTYRRGMTGFQQDRALFQSRRAAFRGGRVYRRPAR
jgi:hypothetical protein